MVYISASYVITVWGRVNNNTKYCLHSITIHDLGIFIIYVNAVSDDLYQKFSESYKS